MSQNVLCLLQRKGLNEIDVFAEVWLGEGGGGEEVRQNLKISDCLQSGKDWSTRHGYNHTSIKPAVSHTSTREGCI